MQLCAKYPNGILNFPCYTCMYNRLPNQWLQSFQVCIYQLYELFTAMTTESFKTRLSSTQPSVYLCQDDRVDFINGRVRVGNFFLGQNQTVAIELKTRCFLAIISLERYHANAILKHTKYAAVTSLVSNGRQIMLIDRSKYTFASESGFIS